MEIPEALVGRRLHVDDRGAVLALDDDRGAQRLALGLLTLFIVSLIIFGCVGVGLVAMVAWAPSLAMLTLGVSVLGAVAAGLAARVGHRTVYVRVGACGLEVDGASLPWADLEGVQRDGGFLVLRCAGETMRVGLHGEDEHRLDALVAWICELQPSP